VSVYADIRSARERLAGKANVTPVMTSRTLDERVGARVFLKCESFQRTGAFKFRGAYNAISRLSDEEKARGVITYSSGNHAQAVALVGSLLGVETTIVMPLNAPATKRAATEGYGARVIEYEPDETLRQELAESIQREEGQVLIPPFDHPHILAGQGTVTMELFDQVDEIDTLLVPVGGGGLLSGNAVAAKNRRPGCRVIGIEPATADDAARSFRTGVLHVNRNPPTIADGTRTSSLGELTFPLIREHADDLRTVTEEAILDAVRFLFYRMKLVIEPSGALGVAALLSGAVQPSGRVGVVVSGGNIDAATMTCILHEATDDPP
jgi:threonine dehydratase